MKYFTHWVIAMNRLERNMLAFLFGLALALALFMPAAHAVQYPSTVFVNVYSDYVYDPAVDPDCSFSNTNSSDYVACVCFNRTGNAANSYYNADTGLFPTGFAGNNQLWSKEDYTCNTGGTHVYYVNKSINDCKDTVGGRRQGEYSPIDLKCKTGEDLTLDLITAYSISTGGGDIDMTEMIDAMNLNAEQVATLILYCCVAVAFMLGVKTGLMR